MITTSYNFNQYQPIQKMRIDIKKLKNKLSKEIMQKVKPLMWESGFVTGGLSNSRNLWIFAFNDFKGYKIAGMITPDFECLGFTDNGCVITDAYMAIVTMDLIYMPIEDLFKLHYWVMSDRYNLFKKQSTD